MFFILRRWDVHDAPIVANLMNNKKIQDNLRDGIPFPYTLTDAADFIATALRADQTKALYRAIDVGGMAVGSIGVFVKDNIYCKTAEIGYWLGEPYWGNGIISSAIRQISDYAFDHLDVVRLYAEPFAENYASRKALENAGFRLEGTLEKNVCKNGYVMDSCMYAKIKRTRRR